MLLSNQQKRFLRKLGHNLKPVILIGSSGIKESLLQEIDTTIEKHELIKIKVKTSDRNQRNKIITEICEISKSSLVNSIGNTALIYRANKTKCIIQIPK